MWPVLWGETWLLLALIGIPLIALEIDRVLAGFFYGVTDLSCG